MHEFNFINSIKQKTYKNSSIIKGVGDDAAVFRQPYQDVVTAVDTFVENVHFTKKTIPPFYIGYRALAANISDLAAMGARPVSYMVSIVVPKHFTTQNLEEIYRGLKTIAEEYQLDLIGGDTVSGEQLVISVTINGAVAYNKARYRHLMKAGDYMFVTGTLGDSKAGLDLLLSGDLQAEHTDYLINRHRMPTPRIHFAQNLTSLKRVALNDISDGIASEINELAVASKLTVYLEKEQLPISNALQQFSRLQQLDYILNGGEDFELVGAVPPEDWDFVKEIANKTKTAIRKIGYVTDERTSNGTVYIQKNGEIERLEASGYVHQN